MQNCPRREQCETDLRERKCASGVLRPCGFQRDNCIADCPKLKKHNEDQIMPTQQIRPAAG